MNQKAKNEISLIEKPGRGNPFPEEVFLSE